MILIFSVLPHGQHESAVLLFSLDELSGVRVALFGFGLMPDHFHGVLPREPGCELFNVPKAAPDLIRGSKFKVEEQSGPSRFILL